MSLRSWLLPRPDVPASSKGARLLRLLLMLTALWFVAWELTSWQGLVAGSCGIASGLWLGELLGRSRIRLPWCLGALAIGAALLSLSHPFWTRTQWLSSQFGGLVATQLSEIWGWGMGVGLLMATLRLLSFRSHALLLLELGVPLLAAASMFSSHRDWNLHRPQSLADWAILQGFQPITVLTALGALGALFLALGLLRWKRPAHFFQGLALSLLLLFCMSQLFDLLPLSSVLKTGKTRPRPSLSGDSNGKRQRNAAGTQSLSKRPPRPRQDPQQVPVAVVLFEHDFRPPTRVYYFRQRVLSEFNGLRMTQARKARKHEQGELPYPALDKTLRLKPQPGKRKKVRTVISLLRSHKAPFALSNAVSLRGLVNPNPRIFLRRYAVVSRVWESSINTTYRLQNPAWSAADRRHYLSAPVDPRYRALLRGTILKPLKKSAMPDNSVLKAYLIKTYLEAHYTYALRRKKNPTGDQVAEFLFKKKRGYCVHFAHAAVFLLRLAGIPARLAEGYAVPESFRGNGSSLLIRDQEAHAWPEIYVHKLGWIAFDIYPRTALNGQLQPPDPSLRKMMAALARQRPPRLQVKWSPGDDVAPSSDSPGDTSRRLAAVWRKASRGGTLGLLTLLSLWLLLRFWRRWGYLLRWGAARHRAYHRSLMDRLCEAGFRRELGETPQAFAQRIALPALREWYSLLEGVAHGSQIVTKATLNEQRRQLECQLWVLYPWWKRALRMFDPFSWSGHLFARWRVAPPLWLRRLQQTRDKLSSVFRRFLRSDSATSKESGT